MQRHVRLCLTVLALSVLVALFATQVGAQPLRDGLPEEVGMSSERLENVFRVVEQGVVQGAYPGAEILVVRKGVVVAHKAFGHAQRIPITRPLEEGTLFDLASVSKLFTATAVMMLVERGYIRLDDPISLFLRHPGFSQPDKANIRVRHLLTHTSGLPSWLPIFREGSGREFYLDRIARATMQAEPGTTYIYSDLGAILLGFIVEEVSGQSLDEFLRENLFEPLGMTNTMYNPGPEWLDRVAATEVDATWRGRVIVGEVHDENAAGLGGVAGHAGLFSTARDLAIFGQMLLNLGSYNGVHVLSPNTVLLMIQNHTFGIGVRRGLGFDLKSSTFSSVGDLMGGGTFGHLGFTGTSIWIDPSNQLVTILLTNRVHPTRDATGITRVRPTFHNAVAGTIIEL
ncbi:MAG: beta-lactamase family protein [Firmicutes bacterium]|jgi:CubicO group peptidase (beta-lactamase class C family)|nr:beta-lactamase family protein [Bacillota bacterium]